MKVIGYARLCWGDYVACVWARKMVAGGLALELAVIWIGGWFM